MRLVDEGDTKAAQKLVDAAAILIRSNETNRFYVHEVLTIKDGAMPFKTGASKKGESGGDTPSLMSILHKIVEVKRKMSSSSDNKSNAIRYSLSAEADRAYMDAVENTNMDAAQVMVDWDIRRAPQQDHMQA